MFKFRNEVMSSMTPLQLCLYKLQGIYCIKCDMSMEHEQGGNVLLLQKWSSCPRDMIYELP